MTFPSVSDVCRATADGDLTLVKILVSRGAPVDALCQAVYVRGGKHSISGWPPVRVAAKFSQYRVLQFLLELGSVDTNRISLDDGRTALHDAVAMGNLLIIDMLLKGGADPMIRDFDGRTCMDIARLERNTVVLEVLLEALARPPILSSGGTKKNGPSADLDYSLRHSHSSRDAWLEEREKAKYSGLDDIDDNKRYTPSYHEKYSSRTKNLDDSGNLKFSGERKSTKYGLLGDSDRWAANDDAAATTACKSTTGVDEEVIKEMATEIVNLQDEMKTIKQRLGMVTDSPTAGRKDSKKKKESTKGASQSTGPSCEVPVLLKNSKYLARFPVPHDKRSWDVPLEGYAPIMFSAQELYTMSREGEQNAKKLADRVEQDGGYEKNMCYYPPIWADPEIYGMTAEDREHYFQFNKVASHKYHPNHGPDKAVEINRVSYLGDYQVHPVTGVPLNPNGRTGMIGRGLLGKYGPNHAADPIVTCWSTEKNVLKLALIKRSDTGQYALPGGMVDPGENELSGTAIREFCEEALEGNDHSKLTPEERKQHRDEMVKRFVEHKKIDAPIVSMVVNDPRNTDNAWMETQAFWFHFHSEEDLGRKLLAGDDAVGAAWVTLDASFDANRLYADHNQIVTELFRVISRESAVSQEFRDLFVPESIKSKL